MVEGHQLSFRVDLDQVGSLRHLVGGLCHHLNLLLSLLGWVLVADRAARKALGHAGLHIRASDSAADHTAAAAAEAARVRVVRDHHVLSLLLRHCVFVELAHGLHLLLGHFAAYSRLLLRRIGRSLPV